MSDHTSRDTLLVQARAAYDRRAWRDAYDDLRSADEGDGLPAPDLERLAMAAYLTGHTDVATDTLERLHHVLLDDGDVSRAARWAIWLAVMLFQGGREAQGGGWLARADRLLQESALDCPERGYVLVPGALQALGGGDARQAKQIFEQVADVAARFDDPDLRVMGVLGLGQSLVAAGDSRGGVRLLDEAMVAVTTDDVSPLMAGITYCAVIIACRDVFDLRRAQEWTAALSRWCSTQQDLRPYQGQCLVHRSEIMQLRGEWSDALDEAERACAHLSQSSSDPVLGMARYQQAELLRLRGQLALAEQSYRQASEWGHPPQPGLALLRLAQGRIDDAVAGIRTAVEDADDNRIRRARSLAAYVEIMLAAGEVEAASAGVDDLEAIAVDFDSLYLAAVSAQSRGAVLLATGDPAAANVSLRAAWRTWQRLEAPFEAARARVLIADACRRLDDHDTATMQLDAARRVFEQLGAAPALERVAALSAPPDGAPPGGLTPREVEVLQLVGTGATNREVADTLVISEKTVARHLSNVYTKLGIPSRAAATSWAYEHGVL